MEKVRTVFLMTPIHQSFEKKGRSEQKENRSSVFWIHPRYLFALIAYLTLKIRMIDGVKQTYSFVIGAAPRSVVVSSCNSP